MIYSLVSLLVLVGSVLPVRAQNIPLSLFSDVKASGIGDIVTILINETSAARNNATAQSAKSNATSIASGAGTGSLGFLPSFGLNSNASNNNQSAATVTSQNSFTARVPAMIIAIKENGNFLIRGSREVETNGDKRVTIIEGEIRPADITAANTVLSSQVANAMIYHQGKGLTHEGSRPGILVRILNWLL